MYGELVISKERDVRRKQWKVFDECSARLMLKGGKHLSGIAVLITKWKVVNVLMEFTEQNGNSMIDK